MDAMKSFAINAQPIDIEDLSELKCLSNGSCVDQPASNTAETIVLDIGSDKQKWIMPSNMNEFYSLLDKYKNKSYTLVSGNTGTNIVRHAQPIDISISMGRLNDLTSVEYRTDRLIIGSRLTITSLVDVFRDASKTSNFEYLAILESHLHKIANRAIRDVATWSGNVAITKLHVNYTSDIVLLFELAGAKLNIFNEHVNQLVQMGLGEYFDMKMTVDGRPPFIHSAEFPAYDKANVFFKTFKVMPRAQNSRGYVISGFRFVINTTRCQERPAIVYCGIKPKYMHAIQTEDFLIGKCLNDQSVLDKAFKILQAELDPHFDPVFSVEYRRSLGVSMFYKFILELLSMRDEIDDRLKSAIGSVHDCREVSRGEQHFQEIPAKFPLTKPMSKLNSYLQTSGVTKYAFDTILPNELAGEFIKATIANGELDTIDFTQAERMHGVVKILMAKDIPGVNSVNTSVVEPLFADGIISFFGQPIGMVIAKTVEQAKQAAASVVVTYRNVKKPIVTLKDAIEQKSYHPASKFAKTKLGNTRTAIDSAPNKLKGSFSFGTQVHFYMEPMFALCSKTDIGGYKIDCTTQHIGMAFGNNQNISV